MSMSHIQLRFSLRQESGSKKRNEWMGSPILRSAH